MGAVWRGTNLLLELPVALKLIRADLDRGALRARLQLEARAAAKLGHPAIVRVFDVGESELGDPYIVMELLHGETLAKLLSRGRLSAARAVQMLLPIIDALSLAHENGIVHRDLKPDNLMLSIEREHVQPKILDFGIAKMTDPRDSDHKLTEIGMVVGSPDYMSPEQARGRDDVDAGTDIWATCVVLYEAITGTAPFQASNYNALLRAIVEDEPRPLSEHAAGDAPLWDVIRRGLQKNRAHRYATMAELGRALASWLLSHGINEDACGTPLESKWFGREQEHEQAAASGTTRAISNEFAPKVTRDSHSGTGIDARGPFTATIRPDSTSRKRNLGIALGATALMGLAALGFTRLQRGPQAPALSQAAALAPLAAAAPAPPPVPSEPRVDTTPTPAAAPPAPAPTTHTDSVAPKRSAAAPKATPKQSKPSVQSEPKSAPAPAPVAVPAKPATRPLDLLAPY